MVPVHKTLSGTIMANKQKKVFRPERVELLTSLLFSRTRFTMIATCRHYILTITMFTSTVISTSMWVTIITTVVTVAIMRSRISPFGWLAKHKRHGDK